MKIVERQSAPPKLTYRSLKAGDVFRFALDARYVTRDRELRMRTDIGHVWLSHGGTARDVDNYMNEPIELVNGAFVEECL